MFEPRNIRQLTIPLAVANWLFGIGIMEFPLGHTRPVVSFIYMTIIIVSFSGLMIISLENFDEWYLTKQTFSENITYRAIFFGNIILAFFTLVLGWFKAKRVKKILTRLEWCNTTMERMGIPKMYRKLLMDQITQFLIIVMIIIIFMAITSNWMLSDATPFGIKVVLIFTLHYPTTMMYIIDVSFMGWIRHIGMKFAQLNDLLRGMLTTTPDSPQHKRVLRLYDQWSKGLPSTTDPSRVTKENVNLMRDAKQIHLELVKLARIVNDIYGVELLLSMTVAFVLITGLLYNVYVIIWLDMPNDLFEKEIISLSCWVFFYVSKIFTVNHTCANASSAAASTGDIICELYEPTTSVEFRAEIRDFTLQLIQNPLTFTASGFFNLDYTFIHGVIGSVTTYLVILIQFSDFSKTSDTTSKTLTS